MKWRFNVFCTLFFMCVRVSGDSMIDPDSYQSITADQRSFTIGQPIVVLVYESTTAESSVGLGLKHGSSIELTGESLDNEKSVGLNVSGKDEGSGKTTRKGVAATKLSVLITDVLSSDMLAIKGEQMLVINGESQLITITGIVRKQDISKENTIVSSRIAGAEVVIRGDGSVSDTGEPGVVYSVLKWLRLI